MFIWAQCDTSIEHFCRSDSIQTVNYDGEDFHLVLSNNEFLMHPFAISVFENWVYWSDWRKNSINRVSSQACALAHTRPGLNE